MTGLTLKQIPGCTRGLVNIRCHWHQENPEAQGRTGDMGGLISTLHSQGLKAGRARAHMVIDPHWAVLWGWTLLLKFWPQPPCSGFPQ